MHIKLAISASDLFSVSGSSFFPRAIWQPCEAAQQESTAKLIINNVPTKMEKEQAEPQDPMPTTMPDTLLKHKIGATYR